MSNNAKFKHTNFFKRDRYQAKIKAAKAISRKGRSVTIVVTLAGYIIAIGHFGGFRNEIRYFDFGC